MSAPAPPRGHDEYEALAVAWAIHALEPADQEIFEAHRDGCDECTLTVVAMLEVAAELAYAVPDVQPPPPLRNRVLVAAAEQQGPARGHLSARPEQRSGEQEAPSGPRGVASVRHQQRSGEQEAPSGPRGVASVRHQQRSGGAEAPSRHARRPGWSGLSRRRLVSTLVAAALVGGSAVATWDLTHPAPASAPTAAADRTATLSAGDGTVATVVAHGSRVDVVTDGLPPNTGRGTWYYVWGVSADGAGRPQVVGSFEVTTSGLRSYPVRLTRPLDDYPVLALSEEPAGSTPTAPSAVLARGALSR